MLRFEIVQTSACPVQAGRLLKEKLVNFYQNIRNLFR